MLSEEERATCKLAIQANASQLAYAIATLVNAAEPLAQAAIRLDAELEQAQKRIAELEKIKTIAANLACSFPFPANGTSVQPESSNLLIDLWVAISRCSAQEPKHAE